MYYVMKANRTIETVIPADYLVIRTVNGIAEERIAVPEYRSTTPAGEVRIVNTQAQRRSLASSGNWDCIATVASRKDAHSIKNELEGK